MQLAQDVPMMSAIGLQHRLKLNKQLFQRPPGGFARRLRFKSFLICNELFERADVSLGQIKVVLRVCHASENLCQITADDTPQRSCIRLV
jgi:hypothetical protein